jgi:serine/threonine-protein kinase
VVELGGQRRKRVGRYVLFDAIAKGGMGAVHLAKQLGPVGFSRTVAVKRLRAKARHHVASLLDEARIASRIHHPNVIGILDVLAEDDAVYVVYELCQGVSLAHLFAATVRAGATIPPSVAVSVMCGALHGLHAAHEAQSELGDPLGIVHRDVSPQNVVLGADGSARVTDFGIALAAGRLQVTGPGVVKGKTAYLAPEQVVRGDLGRAADVYAAGVVLWELLTAKRLFGAEKDEDARVARILEGAIAPPSEVAPGAPAELDELVLRALRLQPRERFETARAFADALEERLAPASPRQVGEWVETWAQPELEHLRERLRAIDREAALFTGAGPIAILHGEGARAATPVPAPPDEPSGTLTAATTTSTDGPATSTDSLARAGGEARPAPSPALPERTARRRSAVPVALLGGALCAALGWAALRRPDPSPRSAASEPSVRPSAPPPAATSAASSSPALPQPSTAPSPIRSARPSVVTPPAASSARPPRLDDCIPPFTLDPDGVKIPKPQCLQRRPPP